MAAVKGACQLKRGETKQATDCEGPNKVANGPPALQNCVRPRGLPESHSPELVPQSLGEGWAFFI